MADQNTEAQPEAEAAASANANANEYDNGPVIIKWAITGNHDQECDVTLFVGDYDHPIAENTMSPGDTNWDTGQHEMSGVKCSASFALQVPTPGQHGQLQLETLEWANEKTHTSNRISNQLLATWKFKP